MYLKALPRIILILIAVTALTPLQSSAYDSGIAEAQRRLAESGFEPGPIDGLIGPRTRRAIKAFQKSNGLSVNGRLDAVTRKTLSPVEPASRKQKSRPSFAGGKLLRYEKLGWSAPQSGADTLSRFRLQTGSLDMKRSASELVLPNGGSVYIIPSGDAVPGFDCDPAKGRIEMEFMLGLGGPVVFRPLDRTGYCQLGFGILLKVGQRLRMSGAMPDGMVEIGANGLVYVESNQ
ncbi:MAG: peptidoglycan-binding protein [Gammaproteobacteria bacterium]|nr:peptidoglycan-binding protein [Gammaproteobacteria bacterium]